MAESASSTPAPVPGTPESKPEPVQARHAIVIDDEPANRDFLERLMGLAGFVVTGAGTAEEALRKIAAMPRLALALVDQELPDVRGVDLIHTLRTGHAGALLVMATMHDGRDLIEEAFAAGVDVYLVKPHGFMELFKRLKESASDMGALRRLIIDQYGPRPFKGSGPLTAPGTT
ncbi:MAG: response regulator [Anaerolineae bacterium]|nr:response regulator [Anaerolineae bacterium]